MRRLTYSKTARRNLAEIQASITYEAGSLRIARDFVRQIQSRCEALAGLPGILGRSRNELEPDLRSIAHKSYIIFFRYLDDEVEIVTVLHGMRDIDVVFDDGSS